MTISSNLKRHNLLRGFLSDQQKHEAYNAFSDFLETSYIHMA